MKKLSLFLLLCTTTFSYSQNITATELLNKAITYHDPTGQWEQFNNTLRIEMTLANGSIRKSDVTINFPKEYFKLQEQRDTITTAYILNASQCNIEINGDTITDNEVLKENNLSCERANLYKNYYTYLYGLPMKLKDPGTIIDPNVTTKKVKNKTYLVLKATYEESVGTDVWFFYFNPTTYAMEMYQFYKGDPKKEGKNTGEYIVLTGETSIQNIKFPKDRAWYYNKDDAYLGTDALQND